MTKKALIFEVVDHEPDGPYQAYWDGTDWVIADSAVTPWYISGSEDDARPVPQHAAPSQSQDAARLLAVALHSEAAVAYVKGEGFGSTET